MNNLVNRIYLALRESLDINSITSFREQIMSYGNKQFIIDLLNGGEINHKDSEAIFLKTPEMWKDLSLADWKNIISSIKRPETYRAFMETSPHFEEVKFLYNWLGIDSISLYKDIPNLSESNRKSLDKNLKYLFGDSYKKSHLEEDFEDGTFCNPEYFQEAKTKLIKEGAKSL